jgi:hypothetical protein
MQRTIHASLVGLVLVAAVAVAFSAMATGAYGAVGSGLQTVIDAGDPTIFAVVAVAPFELRLMGPQALTLDQARTLEGLLAPVADMGLVSLWRTSGEELMTKDGQTIVTKPFVHYLGTSENYFDLMRLPIMDGRGFTAEEVAAGEQVCVIGFDRTDGRVHSDSNVKGSYQVIGRLQPVEGDPFPLPKIWRNIVTASGSRLSMNEIVITPITARAQLPYWHPMGIPEPPTWVVPLVAPRPGQYEEALRITTEFMQAAWPGWAIDVGYGHELQVALQRTTQRVESFFAYIENLLLILLLTSAAGFMVLHVAGSRRTMATQRALGAARVQVLFEETRYGAVASMCGATLGLAAVLGLGPMLSSYLGQEFGMTTGAVVAYAGLVIFVATAVSLGATFWATAGEPGGSLRRGSMVRAGWSLDVRILLAAAAVFLAVSAVTTLVLSSRASVASLSGYLRASGEQSVVVRQDLFAATRVVGQEDLLGPADAAGLRARLPQEFEVVCQSVAPVSVAAVGEADGEIPQTVFVYGLDRLWPQGAGFGLSEEARLAWGVAGGSEGAGAGGSEGAGVGGAPVALIGGALAQKLFDSVDPVGRTLRLDRGVDVRIVGALDPRPEDVIDSLGDRDECLVVLHSTLLQAVVAGPSKVTTEVMVYLPPEESPTTAATVVNEALSSLGRDAVGIKAAAVIDEVTGLRTLKTRLHALQGALVYASLAASALMLGITLQTRVMERRREIGLRRALGASRLRIGLEVLASSLGLCAAGAIAGLGVGVFLAGRICVGEGWVLGSVAGPMAQVALVTLGAALIASLWPLSAALGEDPLVSLREGD